MQLTISARPATKDATNEMEAQLTIALNARLGYSMINKKANDYIATKSTTQCICMYKATIDCKFAGMARILGYINAMTGIHLMAMGARQSE